MDKLLIIDGNSIANRAFYALPFLSNHLGQPSGAVYGFANILVKIIEDQKPTHIAVAFDHARKTFRNKIYADYKGTRRPTPPDLVDQFPIIKEMLSKMKIPSFEFENIEADDIIGTIASKVNCKKVILSGDKDLFQLIDDNTTVCFTKKGVSEVMLMDENMLKQEMGIAPYQIIELKSLMGDHSDNIPGIRGVGEKIAFSLLEKYQTLEGIFENIDNITGKLHDKLKEGYEDGKMSKLLATIKRDCDFEFDFNSCKLKFPFDNEVVAFFTEMDFTSLLRNRNIFNETVEVVEKKDVERVALQTDEQLNLILNSVKDKFAYNLSDMTFAYNDEKEFFLDGNYDMFTKGLTVEEVLTAFKPIFENEKITKLTKSFKDDLHTLDKLEITLKNTFDIVIANYVTTAGIKFERKISVCDYFAEEQRLIKTMKTQGTDYIYYNIELPLVSILKEMEDNGFKVNTEKLDELGNYFEDRITNIVKEIYDAAGEEFNLNSPKQVAFILFEKLGIKSWNNKKGSTSVDVLDELRYIPIVDNILIYRKLSKIMNSYIDVYKKICLTHGDIIHTTFNQTLTSTGRLSSSEPNLQTIPTKDEEGRELRKMFISKFEGGSLVSGDYNQIELRLLAHLSGEEELIKAYNEGKDIHAHTASQIFGVGVDQVTQSMRREAKAVNFGIIYGMSEYGLSQSIKTSQSQAKQYIENYFNRYPKVKQFMDGNVEFARKNGYIKTLFGRIRKIPEISSAKYQLRNFGQRVAMNMPLQGGASDIIKLAMLKVQQALKESKLKSQLILQIHDELIIDVFPGEEEITEKILIDNMENVVKLNVPLIVTINKGKNLFDCK